MAAIIEARDLVKRFDGFTAVDHISFAVPEGVIFGFLGPNGAGKTTTIKMLTTVLTPSEGRLSIAGHDPVKEPLMVRRAFGIVFQDPSLDDELTAAENMELHGVLYRVPRAATPRAHRGAAALCRPVGTSRRLRQALLGRHEAAARNRPRPAAPAAHPVPRRADRRARPPDPQPDLGIHPRALPRRARNGLFHNALHGGGGDASPTGSPSSITAASSRRAPPRRCANRPAAAPWRTRSSR